MFRAFVRTSLLAGAALTATLGVAHAEMEKVKAKLDGGAETPPNKSKGTGQLTGTYDTSSKKLEWTITYSDLSGPATAAHFHAPAPAGKAAGVEIPLKGSLESPIKGEATLTEKQSKNLLDGMTYINIHSKKFPKGELRGQVFAGG